MKKEKVIKYHKNLINFYDIIYFLILKFFQMDTVKYIKDDDGYVKFFFEDYVNWESMCNVKDKQFINIVNKKKITRENILDYDLTDVLRCSNYNKYLAKKTKEYLNFLPLPIKACDPKNNPIKLYPHQIKTLMFMKERESLNSSLVYGLTGGIIRLEMGLGKTLTAITHSLITPSDGVRYPTLIIASKTLLTEWKTNGFEKFFDDRIKVLYLHDHYTNKLTLSNINKKNICNYDFVVTTYDVCSVACRIGGYCQDEENDTYNKLGSGIDIIYKINWERIILDESQKIANPDTWTFKYILLIKGKYKWCLTGTPVKNYDSDIWAQFRFCGYNGVEKKALWSRGYMDYMRQHCLNDAILNIDYENTHITLPEKIEHTITVEFGDMEQKVYDIIQNKTTGVFSDVICGDDEFSSVFGLFTRLRQCCIAPYLITMESKRERKNIKDEKKSTDIILNDLKEKSIKEWLLNKDGEAGIYSAKMKKIIEIIKSIPSDEKLLIFSSYTSVLDLLAYTCKKLLKNFKFNQMDGDTSIQDRESIIQNFKENDNMRCLFMTYKVGSEGLNLTNANHVICIEQWWTPTITKQAITRCYRPGQEKNVHVYNIFVKNSIEERVNGVCSSKQDLSNKILGKEIDKSENIQTKLDKLTLGKILGIYS